MVPLLDSLRRWLAGRSGHGALGRRGEQAAAAFLRQHGYTILGRNIRDRGGEIDLVAQAPDQRTIVIVEVKAGVGGAIRPEVHVNRTKRRKLIALATRFVRRHNFHDRRIRFDVIGVDFRPNDPPTIRHHVAAFDATGRIR